MHMHRNLRKQYIDPLKLQEKNIKETQVFDNLVFP